MAGGRLLRPAGEGAGGAAGAAGKGVSADRWRHDLLAEHSDASALADEAEECMRGAGLWPWPAAGKRG